jgi:transglutaminase-like putative cysteine protease
MSLNKTLPTKTTHPAWELLQRMESLFEDNYHGVSGAGDCDCFTIAAVACAVANDIPVRICIVGNSPKGPSHVYCEMKENGKWVAFDLVNAFYGETKPYKYKKIIAVKG